MLLAGRNFGCGFSREHAPWALNEYGVRTIIAPGYRLTVDLEEQAVYDADGFRAPFAIDPFERTRLLHGLDEIGMTLQHADAITAFEQRRPRWLSRV